MVKSVKGKYGKSYPITVTSGKVLDTRQELPVAYILCFIAGWLFGLLIWWLW